jgi:hypothetical protein
MLLKIPVNIRHFSQIALSISLEMRLRPLRNLKVGALKIFFSIVLKT